MTIPNARCSPPNPTARNVVPQANGQNNATAPSDMKQSPMTGTTRTENAPPVTTPVPYSSSQVPGMAAGKPARYKTAVSNPPTSRGGAKLKTNRRAGAENNGPFAALALRLIASTASTMANAASSSQVASQRSSVGCRLAMAAAASALMPMATPPHPGTAVNEPARSIVSRMRRRLSIAWVCNETGSARAARMLRTVAIGAIIGDSLCVVKWQRYWDLWRAGGTNSADHFETAPAILAL